MVQTWQVDQDTQEGSLAEVKVVRKNPKHIPALPHFCLKWFQVANNDGDTNLITSF